MSRKGLDVKKRCGRRTRVEREARMEGMRARLPEAFSMIDLLYISSDS